MAGERAGRRAQQDSPIRAAGVHGAAPCPCGSGGTYAQCCEPFHDGAPAPTAQALMRSRYTAFVVGDEDYLFRTWHPRTRPEGPYCHPGTRWTGLTIHETVDGGADDEAGIVEFTATYRTVHRVRRSKPGSVPIRSTQPASVTTIFPTVRPLSMRR